MTAGIDAARGDAVIPIDADLQDSPELIVRLVDEWKRGFEVVLAKRADRRADSFAEATHGFAVLQSAQLYLGAGDTRERR